VTLSVIRYDSNPVHFTVSRQKKFLIKKCLKIIRKHTVSVTKTSQLMLYREIMAVCSEINTKHINAVCRQNVELLNVKLVVHIVNIGL